MRGPAAGAADRRGTSGFAAPLAGQCPGGSPGRHPAPAGRAGRLATSACEPAPGCPIRNGTTAQTRWTGRRQQQRLGCSGTPNGPDIITAAAARLLDRVQLETERALEPLVDAAALETTSPGRRRRPGHPCPAPTRRCSRSPRPRAASPRPLRGEAGIPPQQDQRGVPTGLELPSRADVSSSAGAAPSHPGRDGLLGDGWRLELGHGVGLDLVLVLQPVVEDPQGSGTGSRPCRACGARAVHRGTLRYPRCGRRQGRPALPLGGARRAGREPPGGCGWCATLPAAIGRGETAGQPQYRTRR